jgi:class 3 adenylate cyclase
MSDNAIIDLDMDPLAARTGRRRWLLRVGVPIAGVVLVVLVILVIAVYAQNANRAGALLLSDEILATLDARIGEQVGAYFGPAKRGVALARDLLADERPDQLEQLFQKFAMTALKEIPQIDGLNFGDNDGNFVMLHRNEVTGGTDTKVIHNAAGRREVYWIRRDRDRRQTAREVVPNDDYDPRTRPWFKGALSQDETFWTDVYTFYTRRDRGVTAAVRVPHAGVAPIVIGADITIAELSSFLARLKVGTNGRAMIIDSAGRLIAYPHRPANDEAERIDQIEDLAAMAAFDRYRVDGPGRRTVQIGGAKYLTTVTPIEVAGQDWSILIVASEKEFVGFVARNNRVGLVMSLAIVALAIVGAGLIIRSGIRADRAARLALDRSHALSHQSELLQELAMDPALFDAAGDHAPTALTESAVSMSGARRAGVWYLQADGQTLHCSDSYQRERQVHASGFQITRAEVPKFFDSMCSGAEIEVEDAASDPRTADLHRLLLAPLGSRSLSTFPVQRSGQIAGVLLLEDPAHLAGSRQFTRLLAGIAAFRAVELSKAGASPEPPIRRSAHREPAEARSVSADLSVPEAEQNGLAGAVFPQISVLAFHLNDAAAVDASVMPELVDEIIQSIQQIAVGQEIPYLKILGSDVVGAAGFATGDSTAAARIASTAVASRERITELYRTRGLTPDFQLGIDHGAAIGRTVGANPSVFNLWGDAVDTARTMAASALPGAIQASEAAYLALRRSFLFRPRGSFFRPQTGVAQTFILAGRL